MTGKKEPKQIKFIIFAFVILGLCLIATASLGDNINIPEFTSGIVDDTDLDFKKF